MKYIQSVLLSFLLLGGLTEVLMCQKPHNQQYKHQWFKTINHGDTSALGKLKAKGVDINIQDRDGLTLLMYTCKSEYSNTASAHNNCIKIARYLLNQPSIALNIKDKWGHTALSYAAAGYSNELLELLLKAPGIDSNSQDNDGVTPLMAAVTFATPQRVKRLLAVPGLDSTIKDNQGNTALSLATASAKRNPKDQDSRIMVNALRSHNKRVPLKKEGHSV